MLVAFRVRKISPTPLYSPTTRLLSITARQTSSLKAHANTSLWGFACVTWSRTPAHIQCRSPYSSPTVKSVIEYRFQNSPLLRRARSKVFYRLTPCGKSRVLCLNRPLHQRSPLQDRSNQRPHSRRVNRTPSSGSIVAQTKRHTVPRGKIRRMMYI